MNKIKSILLIIAISITYKGMAQSRILPVLEGTTSVKSSAMGGVTMGNTNEMYIYDNPAAMSFNKKTFAINACITAQEKTDAGRLMQYNLGGGYRFNSGTAIMAGVRYLGGLHVNSIKTINEPQTFHPYDAAIDLGCSFLVTPKIAAFTTFSYIKSEAATNTTALSLSVGAAYQNIFNLTASLPTCLTFGVRLLDFGKPVKYNNTGTPQSLPTSIIIGGDWKFNLSKKHTLTYALSCRYFTPKDATEKLLSTGVEYIYKNSLSACMGYQYSNKGNKAITFGAGVQLLKDINLRAAYHHAMTYYDMDYLSLGIGYNM